jgi:hypothetical protein
MSDTEATVLSKVRLAIARYATVFRNNCGAYKSPAGHWLQYGVANPGGSDLIGFRPVEITPDMVGSTIAQFVAIECKSAVGKVSPDQQRFLDLVKKAGGCAGVARSDVDALALVGASSAHKKT